MLRRARAHTRDALIYYAFFLLLLFVCMPLDSLTGARLYIFLSEFTPPCTSYIFSLFVFLVLELVKKKKKRKAKRDFQSVGVIWI